MRLLLIAALLALPFALPPVGTRAAEIEAPGPEGALRGTLAGPVGTDAPVVLMIPGSGTSDRDGNQLPHIRAATLRLLAEGLGARGIVTARVDKRGLNGSSEAASDPEAVTLADYADDARAWIKVLREKTGVSCVWILGHSEGGLVALKAATVDADGICGLLLAAAPGRPLGVLLREQFQQGLPEDNPLRQPTLDALETILVKLEAGQPADVSGVNPQLAAIFRPSVQPFLIDLLAHDPAKMIAQVTLPVLILQGTRDLQVTMNDAEVLAAARPDARLVRLEGVNHMFKPAPAEREGNLAAYADPDLPLAVGVVAAVAETVLDGTDPTSPRSPVQ